MSPGGTTTDAEPVRMQATRLLDRFAAVARPGPWKAPMVHHHVGGRHGFRLVVGVCVHGDEVGPLPAAVELVEELRAGTEDYGGILTIFVGNPAAVQAGRRLMDSDLNRVFLPSPPDDREGRRALALQPILAQADLFLDLHQTGTPTAEAFYTLPWRELDGAWARALAGARLWMTRPWGQVFSTGTCCADEYVRALGPPALTLELSEKGLRPETEAEASRVLRRLLRLAEDHASGRRDIHQAAREQPELEFMHEVLREPFGDPRRALRPGLSNLASVRAGDLLSPPGAIEVRSPIDGLLVFPKYPSRDSHGRARSPVPAEIFRIATPLPDHPRTLWGEGGLAADLAEGGAAEPANGAEAARAP